MKYFKTKPCENRQNAVLLYLFLKDFRCHFYKLRWCSASFQPGTFLVDIVMFDKLYNLDLLIKRDGGTGPKMSRQRT